MNNNPKPMTITEAFEILHTSTKVMKDTDWEECDVSLITEAIDTLKTVLNLLERSVVNLTEQLGASQVREDHFRRSTK